MTTKKIVIAGFALLTIALLAGCETQGPETKEHENILRPPTGSMQTSFSLNQTEQAGGSTQVATTEQTTISVSAADQAAYDAAMNQKDATLCGKITNAEYARQCNVDLNGVLVNDANTKTQQEVMKAAQTASDTIIKTGDYTRCKELKDANQISSCEMNILVNKVLETKDITWCNKASDKTTIEACKSSVGPKLQ